MKNFLLSILFLTVASIQLLAGDGSAENPYTVAEARALAKSSTKIWVQGYIAGGRYDDFEQPWDNDYAVSIADISGETSIDNCIQIKLESATGHRSLYGLNSNPSVFGMKIKAYGFRDDYGGATFPSIEGINDASFIVQVTGGETITVSAPTFTPEAGTFTSAQTVTISTTTDGASIYYTTDGSTPDETSTLYSSVITISETTTIKAIAYKEGTASSVSSATFTIENIPTNDSLFYTQEFTADLGDFTAYSQSGDQAWYWGTFDNGCAVMNGYSGGSNANIDWLISPTFDFSNLSNIVLNYREAIRYLTSYNDLQLLISIDYNGQSVSSANWTELSITGNRSDGSVWTFFDLESNLSAYDGQSNVTIAFKYTSTSDGSAAWEIGRLTIGGDSAVTVVYEPSNHVTNFTAETNTITETSIDLTWAENDGTVAADGYLIVASTDSVHNPVNGSIPTDDTDLTDGNGNVMLAHGNTSYTFDNCASGTTYFFKIFPFLETEDTVLFKTDNAPKTTATTIATNDTVATPVFVTDASITYTDSVVVEISCETEGASIYYTLDGSQPSSSSALYSAPIVIYDDNTIVTAIAILNGTSSNVTEAQYHIEKSTPPVTVATPVISPESGSYSDSVEITITCETADAIIYYTFNGVPTIENRIQYTAPFFITEDATISAIAVLDTTESAVTRAAYTITTTPVEVATPVFVTDASITYTDSVVVEISCETEGASIYYTLDGSQPSSSSTLYAAPIVIYDDNTIVTVIAILNGTSSNVTEAQYHIEKSTPPVTVATPVISPESGSYSDSVEITITCETADAIIYYAFNGVPTVENRIQYTKPFFITEDATISAIAVLDTTESAVTHAAFTITTTPVEVATPVFVTDASITYTDSVLVEISCETEGASIYYAINDTATTETGILYDGPFYLKESANITAIAIYQGETSNMSSALYTVSPTIITVAEPVFLNEAGTYNDSVEVSIRCETEGATIYYNLEGLTSSKPYTKYTGPFYISQTTSIAAYANLDNVNSDPIEVTYTIRKTDVTAMKDPGKDVKIYGNGMSVVLKSMPEGENRIDIYAITGQKIRTASTSLTDVSITMDKKGIYLVVLLHNNVQIVGEKVIVK